MIDLAAQLLNRPLAISPDAVPALLDRITGERDMGAIRPVAAQRFTGAPPYIIRNGVAHIMVEGTLINRGNWWGPFYGYTTYEGLMTQIDVAMTDDAVSSVLFDINCPGGSCDGFEAAMGKVAALTARKPTVAYVNALAASAAYGLASQCGRIILAPGGVVGSIGVIGVHLDLSAAYASAGVKPTIIAAGDKKADGTPLLPLSERAAAEWREMVNDFYSTFCRFVGQGRGNRLTAAGARATEAGVYMGEKAIAAGLADSIASFDDVLASLARTGKSVMRAGKAKAETRPIAGIRAEIAPGVVTTFASRADFDRYVKAEATKGITVPAAERAKLADAIRALPGAKKYPAEAARLIAEGKATIEAARALFDGLERAGAPTSEHKTFAQRSAAFASRKISAGATVVTGDKIFRGGREAEGGVGGVIAAEHNPKMAEEMSALSGWNLARAKHGLGSIPLKEAGDAL